MTNAPYRSHKMLRCSVMLLALILLTNVSFILVVMPGQRWSPLFLLALGMGFMLISPCTYVYQSMVRTNLHRGLQGLGRLFSSLIAEFARRWHANQVRPGSKAADETKDSHIATRLHAWHPYLPYGLVISTYLILEQISILDPRLGVWLSWGGELIIVFVLLWQMMTLRENNLLIAQVCRQAEALQREMEERQQIEAQLAYKASHDSLTGLPNRALFMDRLHHAIAFAKRQHSYRFAVLFLDLDHFKAVNDSLGHAIGDQLLIGIAQRLRLCLHTGDTVARLGGDEFVVLLENTKDLHQASTAAEQIQASLRQPFIVDGHQLFATASIGILADTSGYDQAETVLRDADSAMYQAKARGKARNELFRVTNYDLSQTGLGQESDLRQMLVRRGATTTGSMARCRQLPA